MTRWRSTRIRYRLLERTESQSGNRRDRQTYYLEIEIRGWTRRTKIPQWLYATLCV